MARYKMRFKNKVNISRVITKVVATVLILYVGGQILTEVGNVMNGTTSVFNKGLSLIGWTVDANGMITDTSSATGLLTVVGIIAVASIVLEFVKFKL